MSKNSFIKFIAVIMIVGMAFVAQTIFMGSSQALASDSSKVIPEPYNTLPQTPAVDIEPVSFTAWMPDPDPGVPMPTPIIVVTAPPLEMTLYLDQVDTITFTIANIGNDFLIWSLAEDAEATWLAEAPTGSMIDPGYSAEVVTVTFDSTGLAAGDYMTTLVITHNDIYDPSVVLDVKLTVQGWTLFLPVIYNP